MERGSLETSLRARSDSLESRTLNYKLMQDPLDVGAGVLQVLFYFSGFHAPEKRNFTRILGMSIVLVLVHWFMRRLFCADSLWKGFIFFFHTRNHENHANHENYEIRQLTITPFLKTINSSISRNHETKETTRLFYWKQSPDQNKALPINSFAYLR